MKRIREFRILALAPNVWNVRDKNGQWRLSRTQLTAGSESYTSWHRCWNDALAKSAAVNAESGNGSQAIDIVVVAERSKIVLAVVSALEMEQLTKDSNGDSLWKSTVRRNPNPPTVDDANDVKLFASFNELDIAWVSMTGAIYDVPCSLGSLERRARRNPDGFYGRVIAFKNEMRDYFRKG